MTFLKPGDSVGVRGKAPPGHIKEGNCATGMYWECIESVVSAKGLLSAELEPRSRVLGWGGKAGKVSTGGRGSAEQSGTVTQKGRWAWTQHL